MDGGYVGANDLLHFRHRCVWYERAVRVPVSNDQQRYLLFDFATIKEDDSPARCAQQIASLEPKTKGGPGDLSNEKIALFQPRHIAAVYVLGANGPVRFPGVVTD